MTEDGATSSPPATGDAEFLGFAQAEQSRVERLFSRPRSNGLMTIKPWRKRDSAANVVWSSDFDDPEFQKNLRLFARLICGAIGVYQRRISKIDNRVRELQDCMTLPCDRVLNLRTLLCRRFALELLMVELGDETYLRSRSVELYEEPASTYATWRSMYGASKPPLYVDGQKGLSSDAKAVTRNMLTQLLAAKQEQDFTVRARREMKQKAIRSALPLLGLACLVFGGALYASVGGSMVLPVAAAVTGAALGRLLHFRDEVSRGTQVREFRPLFAMQLLVGAATGLLVVVITSSMGDAGGRGIVSLGSANAVAAFSFAVGFSESAFLKLVSKLAGEASKPAAENEAP